MCQYFQLLSEYWEHLQGAQEIEFKSENLSKSQGHSDESITDNTKIPKKGAIILRGLVVTYLPEQVTVD